MNPAAAAPRSYLFVPGDRPDRFEKAWASPGDALILDLEDAVAPTHKTQARAAIMQWLSRDRPVWIRINAADTAWFDEDLALIGRVGVAGVIVPKADELPPRITDLAVRHGIGLIPLVGDRGWHREPPPPHGGARRGPAGLRCHRLPGGHGHPRRG
jgi:citrate lyase subunit beta/citryl-CoA lyase